MNDQPQPAASSSASSSELPVPEDDVTEPNTEQNAVGGGAVAAADSSETAAAKVAEADADAKDELPWDRSKDWQNGAKPQPVSLSLLLPPIRAELSRSVNAANAIITILQEHRDTQGGSTAPSSQDELRKELLSLRAAILNGLETAAVHITTSPGYMCLSTSKQHNERFAERYRILCDVEAELKKSIDDAEPLYAARDQLIRAERRIHRRKLFQTAVRAASVVAVPFSPFASAVLTAVDVMVLSFVVGLQDVVLPDATAQVRETLDRVEALQKNIERKLEEVKGLKASLDAIKAATEEVQRSPIVVRLGEILEKVQDTKKAVEAVFSFPCPCSCDAGASTTTAPSTPVSVREVVAVFRRLGDALDAPSILSGPLESVNDEQCDVLDRYLADLRLSRGVQTESQTLV